MRIRKRPFKLTISQMLTIGVGIVAVVLIFNMAQKSVFCQQKQAERDALAREVQVVESQVKALRQQLDESGSNATIESSLREDFGMVGRNEGTAILQFEESPAAAQPALPSETQPKESEAPHWTDWAKALINP